MLSDPSTPVRYYVGLDVHRDTIYSCVYDASANVLQAFGIGASAHGGAFPLGTPMSREIDTKGSRQIDEYLRI